MAVSFVFLDFHQLGRDGEGGEGFEEDGPGGKDRVGCDGGQMGEEAGSLGRGLAGGYPGWLEQFERGVPGEGEEVQARQLRGSGKAAQTAFKPPEGMATASSIW